jgi:hypothetical protein
MPERHEADRTNFLYKANLTFKKNAVSDLGEYYDAFYRQLVEAAEEYIRLAEENAIRDGEPHTNSRTESLKERAMREYLNSQDVNYITDLEELFN